MFDADKIRRAIGEAQYAAVNASNLPKIETMTLLHIWMQSSPAKLRELAHTNALLPALKKQYRLALERRARRGCTTRT